MGEIRLIDVFTRKNATGKEFIICVLYSVKSKCIVKILKLYEQNTYDNLYSLINEDVSSYVVPSISYDGKTYLDINL